MCTTYNPAELPKVGHLEDARHAAMTAIKTATPTAIEYTITAVSTGLRFRLFSPR